MDAFFDALGALNDVLWHDAVLYTVLATGVLFTVWTKGSQYHALTHGVRVTAGKYDKADDPGAIHHFQALSAALSATVGIGNIGGVALAISLGGPGAVFWMWIIGAIGMALKTAEVSLSMLYRDVSDPEQPHGGPMVVARKAFADLGMVRTGKVVGAVFVVTLMISSVTGGNMFQAWNVAEVSHLYFGVPKIVVGLVLAVVVGAVILGGIRRIGKVAGRLVPFMCGLYLLAAIVVVIGNAGEVPGMLRSIVVEAFSPSRAQGAFLGGSAGYAMLWGLKRALFSSEAGQGSSPIAHCAAKTDEPIREGIVAGLEPFIDTLVVCTLTSLVILTSGIWSREPDVSVVARPAAVHTESGWTLAETTVELGETGAGAIPVGRRVFTIVTGDPNPDTGNHLHSLAGRVVRSTAGQVTIAWDSMESTVPIVAARDGVFWQFQGAALTARAFDRTVDGLGKWLVTIAAWLFAISTMISWSYYGEQGVRYLGGGRGVLAYKLAYCGMAVVATVPSLLETDEELDDLTTLGTGVMLWANIPILLVFSSGMMRAYRSYRERMAETE